MSEAWFRIALADQGGVRLVVAPGEHLGAAIEVARARAGRGDAWPVAAAIAPAGEVPLGESVGKGVVVERDPPSNLPVWRWPSGVLPTLDGAARLGPPAEGHRRTDHDGTIAIEAVVAGDRLAEVFLDCVERLPTADNVEVRVTGHHDGAGSTEVWLTPRFGDVRRAIRFLDDHDVELIANGHVELGVYLRAQKSTLRLTEHKTIVWVTEDADHVAPFVARMDAHGIPATDALTLVSSVDHHHWRPASTRPRAKLLHHLHKLRLRKVDSWPDPS